MPPRIVGNLDMADARHKFFQRRPQFAFHALHVINIILELEIVGTDIIHDFNALFRAVQEKSRNVIKIDRLGDEQDVFFFEGFGREGKIGNQRGVAGAPRHIAGQNARQAIHRGAAQRLGIINGRAHAVLKLADPVRQAAKAALARLPVSRRKVEQNLLQVVLLQKLRHLFLGIGIGPHILNPGKARPGRRRKALEEIMLGEKHGKIGAEFWHQESPSSNNAGAPAKALTSSI